MPTIELRCPDDWTEGMAVALAVRLAEQELPKSVGVAVLTALGYTYIHDPKSEDD